MRRQGLARPSIASSCFASYSRLLIFPPAIFLPVTKMLAGRCGVERWVNEKCFCFTGTAVLVVFISRGPRNQGHLVHLQNRYGTMVSAANIALTKDWNS